MSDDAGRTARIEEVHQLAMGMPYVTVENGTRDNPVCQVGGKSFIFFRNPRRDAIDPENGERYRDVIVFWGRSGHEDAERVPCQIGERVQGLVGIVSPIEQNHCTQGHRALPLPLELGAARNSEIEVQLLRHS